jgi:hypothetical protein
MSHDNVIINTLHELTINKIVLVIKRIIHHKIVSK